MYRPESRTVGYLYCTGSVLGRVERSDAVCERTPVFEQYPQ